MFKIYNSCEKITVISLELLIESLNAFKSIFSLNLKF